MLSTPFEVQVHTFPDNESTLFDYPLSCSWYRWHSITCTPSYVASAIWYLAARLSDLYNVQGSLCGILVKWEKHLNPRFSGISINVIKLMPTFYPFSLNCNKHTECGKSDNSSRHETYMQTPFNAVCSTTNIPQFRDIRQQSVSSCGFIPAILFCNVHTCTHGVALIVQ